MGPVSMSRLELSRRSRGRDPRGTLAVSREAKLSGLSRRQSCSRSSCVSPMRIKASSGADRGENTSSVAAAVLSGDAEIGRIEGVIDEPALAIEQLARTVW
jgi:hypothetical protein